MTSNSKHPETDFKPEVIGRIDAVLKFRALDNSIMRQLIDKQARLLNDRLKGKKLEIKLDPTAYHVLTEQGYDATYGARPLNAVFNRLVTRPLSRLILEDKLPQGTVTLKWDGREMIVS
jgi:ATP-dependent Clp protease ATP-binding subunit ClpB